MMKKTGFLKVLKSLTVKNLVARVIRYRLAALAAVAALTCVFVVYLPHLHISTSVYDLVIEDLPENVEYQNFKSIFGNEEIIRVVIKSKNIFDAAVFRKVEELSAATQAVEGVRRVISLPEIRKVVDPTGQWSLERFQGFVADVPMFQRNLISKDRKTTAITLVLADDARQDSVIKAVQKILDHAGSGLTLYQIGMPLISKALAEFTARDFERLPPITFVVIGIMLVLMLRSLRYVLLTLGCVSLTLVWTFGMVAISGLPLSMLTMIVPVFLIAVGTAYCLHIMASHRHILATAPTAVDAVMQTYAAMAFPTVLAVATTVLSLCSLFLGRITAIHEFAYFACGGMLCFLTILVLFLPAAMSFIKPRPPQASRGAAGLLRPLIDALIGLHLKHQKKALFVVGGIALFCLAGLFQLRVETNPVGFFKKSSAIYQHFHDIYRQLSGSFPVYLTMQGPEDDFFENPENIAAMESIQQFAESLPGVDKSISFADYLKMVNFASNRFEKEYYRLPTEAWELRMLINTFRSLLGNDVLSACMNSTFSQANIMLLTHISSSRDFLDLRKTLLTHASQHFARDIQWRLTGFGMAISASSEHLTWGQVKSLSLTLIAIAVIMFALFLSYKVGLIAVLPNLFPIVVNFGIMGWLDMELSMATSLIASVAIGLAVDDTIHYLVRFNSEFRKDLDDRRALRQTLQHMGPPIIFTTLTLGLGFSILLFSSFKPTVIFGLMMVITMLSALVGDLVLLPALMQRVELVTLWDLVRIRMGAAPALEIPLFKGLSRTERHSVMMAGTLVQVPAGDMLFRKGDTSETMYAVISGSFDVFDYESSHESALRHGIQKKIGRCRAGEILGEMGLLRAAPRSATVTAAEDSELLLINWKVVQRLLWLYPPVAVKFFRNLTTILSSRVERLTHCLADESTIDDLTGMYNRKGFCQILEQEAKRAVRYEEPLCLGILDVDFNGYTPEQGEDLRHDVIKALAQSWRGIIRECDTLSRISVQRFLLLMPKMERKDVHRVFERVQASAGKVRQDFGRIRLSLQADLLDLPMKEGATGGEALLDNALKVFPHPQDSKTR